MSSADTGYPNLQNADIVVAGAGMAGLYFTWRMLKAKPGTNIVIVEQLARTGGRLDTDLIYVNGEPVKNEEGGMRFTTDMANLMWLLQQLGKDQDIMPFAMGDDNNIYNLRGKRFTFGQMLSDPFLWSTVYDLLPAEQNMQPNDVLKGVLESILSQNSFPAPHTPTEWQNFRMQCTYRGIPLYQWGFWALLVDFGLSQECLQMIEDSMGFLAFYDQEVNAGVGFQTMGDFDNLPQYQTLVKGYETLADSLAREIAEMGGQIYLSTPLQTFQVVDETGMLWVTTPQTVFVTPQLILAMPSLALQALPPDLLGDQFQSDIATVTSMPLTKVNLYFEQRWWFTRYNIGTGGSFTDLPMAQFYCYQPISDDISGPASMTVYCDFDRTGYWDGLQRLGTAFPTSSGWAQPPNTVAASTFVVEAAMRQLAEFFGDSNLPAPMLSTYVGWGTGNIGDGDHSWKIGVNDREVMQRLCNPMPGKVYTCGEAFSDEQAWVDGALRSTETLLQQYFGLPPYN